MISSHEADGSPLSFDVNFPFDIGNNLINRQNSFPNNITIFPHNEQEEENRINSFSSLSNRLCYSNDIEEKSLNTIGNPSTSKNMNNFDNNYSKTLSSSKKDKNKEISLLEDEEKEVNDLSTHNHNVLNKYKKKFVIKKKPLFKVKPPKKNKLKNSAKNSSDSIKEDDKKIFLGKKEKKERMT